MNKPDDPFDALHDWTADLAALHEAFSDPIWQRIGRTPRGTFQQCVDMLIDTCKEYGVAVDGQTLDQIMNELRRKVDNGTRVRSPSVPRSTSPSRSSGTRGDA